MNDSEPQNHLGGDTAGDSSDGGDIITNPPDLQVKSTYSHRYLVWTIAALAIITIASLIYFFYQALNITVYLPEIPPAPIPTTPAEPTPTQIPNRWNTLSDFTEFTFLYPSDWKYVTSQYPSRTNPTESVTQILFGPNTLDDPNLGVLTLKIYPINVGMQFEEFLTKEICTEIGEGENACLESNPTELDLYPNATAHIVLYHPQLSDSESRLIKMNNLVLELRLNYEKPYSENMTRDQYKKVFKDILYTLKLDESALYPPSSQDINTYRSECGFSVSYPSNWNASKYFVVDNEEACTLITAPDYSMLIHADGFYINITRKEIGSTERNMKTGQDEVFNNIEEYVALVTSGLHELFQSEAAIPRTMGEYSGIERRTCCFESGKGFTFQRDNIIYDIVWPVSELEHKLESPYGSDLETIIKSIKFD
jgi:hypothetical protein